MANKNTNMILAVAVIAVCAIAIIGVGYAYTATTQNAGNDVTVKYITLSQAAYANNFDETIEYNTTNHNGTITYTPREGQTSEIYDGGPEAVALGSTTITVGRSANNSDSFKFSVKNLDIPEGASMAESGFYIGIKVGNTDEVVRAFTVNEDNYYSTAEGHAAATSGIDIPLSNNLQIIVTMYYVPTSGEPAVQPLNNVTFEFKATAPDAVN